MELLKEQCAELMKGRLRYCYSLVWMKIGGQIPWNATAFCEIFKTDCPMGRHHTKDVFGEPFQAPIIPFGSLVEYSQKVCHESIS